MYQALYRKYRPQRFDDVVGQNHITKTLKNQVAASRTSHAYLFTGTRGTGKTTCARLLARAVNCEHPVDGNPCNECASCRGILDGSILDILELDAASNTGVDNMRAILEETIYPPTNVRMRVYIIDEVHMLSAGAFNALLKTLEEPPEYVMFILGTTELNRVAATVQSRCQRFDFKRITQLDLAANLSRICEKEGISIEPDALEMLARLADGSARDSLSLLERCLSQREDRVIDLPGVISALGVSPSQTVDELARAIASMDATSALTTLDRLYMDGRELRSILETLALYFRDILLTRTAPSASSLISPENNTDAMRETAKLFTPRRAADIIAELQKTIDSLTRSSAGRLESELCLIRLCTPELLYTADPDMTGRLAALESRVRATGAPTAAVFPASQEKPPAPKKEVPKPMPPAERQETEEAPPFTDADIPPWDESAFAPPEPPPAQEKPAPKPKSTPPQEKKNEEKASAFPTLSPERKKALLDALKPKLSRSITTYLTLSTIYLSGDSLYIRVESDLSRSMLDKADVKATVAESASAQWGGNVRVFVTSGDPAAAANTPEISGFDQILALGRDAGIKIDLK